MSGLRARNAPTWSCVEFSPGAFDLALRSPGRRPGIDGFEIVIGAEESLAAGLALALGDGAERIEAARDGGEKAFLGLDVGGDRPEQRRLRLVGAVGAAEALDGGVSLPARFEQVVDPQALILRRKIRMIGASGAAC